MRIALTFFMKTFLCAVFLFTFFFLEAQKPEAEIRNLLNQQISAWNQGDIEGFMETYWKNDSLMFVSKNGITWGWNNTLNVYKKSYPG